MSYLRRLAYKVSVPSGLMEQIFGGLCFPMRCRKSKHFVELFHVTAFGASVARARACTEMAFRKHFDGAPSKKAAKLREPVHGA